MHVSRITIAAVIAVICTLSQQSFAFTPTTCHHHQQQSSRAASIVTSLHYSSNKNNPSSNEEQPQLSQSTRRSALTKLLTATATASTLLYLSQPSHATSPTTAALLTDLQTSLTKLTTIPPLLQQSNWDAVRTILKTPPVNQLWNLGENSNTIVKLAKETGELDLLELKDELAISLQMTDQYSYDNVFIYYQPGE